VVAKCVRKIKYKIGMAKVAFSFFFTGKLVLNSRKKLVKDLKSGNGEEWRLTVRPIM
jgi:hypothetical protein